MEMKPIVFIDDDKSMRELYETISRIKNWENYIIENPEQLNKIPNSLNIALVVSDCQMGKWTYQHTMQIMNKERPATPTLYTSGDHIIMERLKKAGYNTLSKPWNPSELYNTIEDIIGIRPTREGKL